MSDHIMYAVYDLSDYYITACSHFLFVLLAIYVTMACIARDRYMVKLPPEYSKALILFNLALFLDHFFFMYLHTDYHHGDPLHYMLDHVSLLLYEFWMMYCLSDVMETHYRCAPHVQPVQSSEASDGIRDARLLQNGSSL